MTYYLECLNYLYSFDTGLTQLLITLIWSNFNSWNCTIVYSFNDEVASGLIEVAGGQHVR